MFLYHYFERERGPFLTLSDLNHEKSVKIHLALEKENNSFAKRGANGQYMNQRRITEQRAYSMFLKKGGKPQRRNPHYAVLEEKELDECNKWFLNTSVIKIPLSELDKNTISFTYGDSFQIFECIFEEKPEYDLYMVDEILEIIKKRGMPPHRNETMHWLEPSYIEAQIWSDDATLEKYKKLYL